MQRDSLYHFAVNNIEAGEFVTLLAPSGYGSFEFYYLCGATVPAMIRLCRSPGYHITGLGPARQYWGVTRYPIRFNIPQSVSMLRERWGYINLPHTSELSFSTRG